MSATIDQVSRASNEERMQSAVDAIVPADGFPSASQAGSLAFWEAMLAGERPQWRHRLAAVLDLLDVAAGGSFPALDQDRQQFVLERVAADPDYVWFASMTNYAFYAEPRAWSMLGWSPDPAGGWPGVDVPPLDRSPVIRRDQLLPRYDAIVIGSGAGGGVAASILSQTGRSVLLVERGDFPDRAFLAQDHLRNARTDIGLDHRTLVSSPENPRVLELDDHSLPLGASDPRWGSNAYTLGGGTRIYGAQAWRFVPEDFRMASTYGVPDGSALADWPIGYDDLEQFYSQAEWEVGVCGSAEGDSKPARRSRPFPMPAMPFTAPGLRLAAGAVKLGIRTLPVPLAINSVPRDGRPACARCRQCIGFTCPIEAKNGSHNTTLARAAATGRLHLLLGTRAERLITGTRGRVRGVALVGDNGGSRWRSLVTAPDVVLAAGAIESARLLLCSTSESEPSGVGNNTDQVGRHLQGHLYGGALGIFEDPVNDYVGPGPSIATNDFRHFNTGLVGGGMIANEFVPTPIGTFSYLRDAGLLPLHGASAKAGMRHLISRLQRVVGPVQEMTSAESRMRLDPLVTDSFGIPVARLSGSNHPEDHRVQRFLGERASEWLVASGATTTVIWPPRPTDHGPSSGQHQAGTCRMGTDPGGSVTDPYGRVWGHDNLRVVDGSTHVTNGGVNPVLTIYANAFRIMRQWLGG
jgi:choline dehydrogenase-like flavoprotein